MKLNGTGQVTIPADLRHSYHRAEGDEVDVVEDGSALRIVHLGAGGTRGRRVVSRMRGRATAKQSTDALMDLLRGE